MGQKGNEVLDSQQTGSQVDNFRPEPPDDNHSGLASFAAEAWAPKDSCKTSSCDDFKSLTNAQMIEKGSRLELTNFFLDNRAYGEWSSERETEASAYKEAAAKYGIPIIDIKNSSTRWTKLDMRIKQQGANMLEREWGVDKDALKGLEIDSQNAQDTVKKLAQEKIPYRVAYPRSLALLMEKVSLEKDCYKDVVKELDLDPRLADKALKSEEANGVMEKMQEHYHKDFKDWHEAYQTISMESGQRSRALYNIPEAAQKELNIPRHLPPLFSAESESLRKDIAIKLGINPHADWTGVGDELSKRTMENIMKRQSNDSRVFWFQQEHEIKWPGLRNS